MYLQNVATNRIYDMCDAHQSLSSDRGMAAAVATMLGGTLAVPTPDLDYQCMRALVYHDYGSQKFNPRDAATKQINDKKQIEKAAAGKDFTITGMCKVLQFHFNTVGVSFARFACVCV